MAVAARPMRPPLRKWTFMDGQKSLDRMWMREKIIWCDSLVLLGLLEEEEEEGLLLEEAAADSARDLTRASTSRAAFLRFSYDRSPRARWTSGGRGDSTLLPLIMVNEDGVDL